MVKRRRFGRRRFSRKRTQGRLSWTSQAPRGQGMNYKSRKMKRRAWAGHLWRKTLADTHFRSSGNGTTGLNTNTTVGVGLSTILRPTFIGTPGPTTAFWTTTGGLQVPDVGSSAYTFSGGNLIIRGGQVGITISAPDTVTDDCNVKIYVVRLTKRPDDTLVIAAPSYGSMIDATADFSNFGKVLYSREATVNYQNPSFTLVHRLRCEKIDMEMYGTTLGQQIAFVAVLTNMIDGTANTLSAVIWHDLSFSGDVVTSTL